MTKALNALSTLKRALGIPNVPNKRDIIDAGYCHVFTPDAESADLLAEIFHALNEGKTGYTEAQPEMAFVVGEPKISTNGKDLFAVSIRINSGRAFAEGLDAVVKRHIAPDAGLKF